MNMGKSASPWIDSGYAFVEDNHSERLIRIDFKNIGKDTNRSRTTVCVMDYVSNVDQLKQTPTN